MSGKPNGRMIPGILHERDLAPNELAMVGDRIYTDMAMARRAGTLGVLVLSGESSLEDAQQAADQIDLIVEDLDEFGRLLEDAHTGRRLRLDSSDDKMKLQSAAKTSQANPE